MRSKKNIFIFIVYILSLQPASALEPPQWIDVRFQQHHRGSFFKLSWKPVIGAQKYKVYCRGNHEAIYHEINTSKQECNPYTCVFVDQVFLCGSEGFYVLRSIANEVISDYSHERSFTRPSTTASFPSFLFTKFSAAHDSVELRWRSTKRTDKFRVQRIQSPSTTFISIAETDCTLNNEMGDCLYYDTHVDPGVSYYYQIVFQSLPYTRIMSIAIPKSNDPHFLPPRLKQATPSYNSWEGDCGIKLSWVNDNPHAIGFYIYRRLSYCDNASLIEASHKLISGKSSDENEFVDWGVDRGYTYEYLLTSVLDDFNESAFSNPISFTVKCPGH